jgi:antitoxin VapB
MGEETSDGEVNMNTAKLFKNGQSQAVRLPKECRFEGDEVYINKIGDVVMLIPKKKRFSSLINSLNKFTPDFMSEREQPKLDEREEIF